MSDWRQQYEDAAEAQARRFARFSDAELLNAIRRNATGDYYVVWYELAKRKPSAEMCWLLYSVLRSDQPYLTKYHCATALLKLLQCQEFEEVDLSGDWPVVPDNLTKVHGIIEAKFGPQGRQGAA